MQKGLRRLLSFLYFAFIKRKLRPMSCFPPDVMCDMCGHWCQAGEGGCMSVTGLETRTRVMRGHSEDWGATNDPPSQFTQDTGPALTWLSIGLILTVGRLKHKCEIINYASLKNIVRCMLAAWPRVPAPGMMTRIPSRCGEPCSFLSIKYVSSFFVCQRSTKSGSYLQ